MMYVLMCSFCVIIGALEENAVMYVAAGLFAIASKIQAKKDGDGI